MRSPSDVHGRPSAELVKLELTPEELQRLDSHPLLRSLGVGQPVKRTLRSIYFDTPDDRLRQAGLSLRLRSNGGSWVQTIKADGHITNGVSQPIELEAALGGPDPDLSRIDRRLRRRIAGLTQGSLLEPVFETVVTRTARKLHTEQAELELALDQGLVRAGKSERPLCEAELELKSGSAESLLETAAKLFADTPVRIARATKAEWGYDLRAGRTSGSPRPARAEPTDLAPGATCHDTLAQLVRSANTRLWPTGW